MRKKSDAVTEQWKFLQIVGPRRWIGPGEPARSYPREFLDAAIVAFVEIERNYIARQNRDRETRYGSQREEDPG